MLIKIDRNQAIETVKRGATGIFAAIAAYFAGKKAGKYHADQKEKVRRKKLDEEERLRHKIITQR